MKKTFLHLSDIHFRRAYPRAEGGYPSLFHKLPPPLALIDDLFRAVPPESLDFVLLTGDLTEDGDSEDYRALRAHLTEWLGDVPLFVTLGNHDNRPAFYSGWLGEAPRNAPYHRLWRTDGGPAVISLDNSRPGVPDGGLDEGDVDALEDMLRQLRGAPCLLITHHHLLAEQYPMPSAPYPPRLGELISDSSIMGIFSGHTHHLYAGSLFGRPYYASDSLSFAAERDGEGVHFSGRAGAGLFELTEEGFTLRSISVYPKTQRLVSIKLGGAD